MKAALLERQGALRGPQRAGRSSERVLARCAEAQGSGPKACPHRILRLWEGGWDETREPCPRSRVASMEASRSGACTEKPAPLLVAAGRGCSPCPRRRVGQHPMSQARAGAQGGALARPQAGLLHAWPCACQRGGWVRCLPAGRGGVRWVLGAEAASGVSPSEGRSPSAAHPWVPEPPQGCRPGACKSTDTTRDMGRPPDPGQQPLASQSLAVPQEAPGFQKPGVSHLLAIGKEAAALGKQPPCTGSHSSLGQL